MYKIIEDPAEMDLLWEARLLHYRWKRERDWNLDATTEEHSRPSVFGEFDRIEYAVLVEDEETEDS